MRMYKVMIGNEDLWAGLGFRPCLYVKLEKPNVAELRKLIIDAFADRPHEQGLIRASIESGLYEQVEVDLTTEGVV